MRIQTKLKLQLKYKADIEGIQLEKGNNKIN